MPYRQGVCAFDGKARLQYVSHTFGAFDADAVLGHPVWNGCENEAEIRGQFAECLMTGRPVSGQSVVVDPGGVRRTVSYVFHPLPSGCEVMSVWLPPMTGRPLAPREKQVLALLVDGYRLSEIAKELRISVSTVKATLRAVRAKFEARTNAHLVALAVRSGVC